MSSLGTPAPPGRPILLADLAARDEGGVARLTDVVVAWVRVGLDGARTAETVEARVPRPNRVLADVAARREGEGLERAGAPNMGSRQDAGGRRRLPGPWAGGRCV